MHNPLNSSRPYQLPVLKSPSTEKALNETITTCELFEKPSKNKSDLTNLQMLRAGYVFPTLAFFVV